MTKNNYWFHRLKNHKVSVSKVVVCLALIILVTSFALIQGFAYQLPLHPGASGNIINTGGFLSATYLDMLYSLVGYQQYCGSFNIYEVVAVYYNPSNLQQIRMVACYGYYDLHYEVVAGIYEPVSSIQSVSSIGVARYTLGELGFQSYSNGTPQSVTEEHMIMYRNSAGELVVNANVSSGTSTPSGIMTAYSQWRVAANDVVGGDVQGAYNEGYQDGYDDGRTEGFADGRETGYAEGYSVGYDVGLSVGGGGDVVITEEIDVGSLITALPQAARNIIDGAFGFTIFGINIAATLIAILVVAIVAFIVRWLLK